MSRGYVQSAAELSAYVTNKRKLPPEFSPQEHLIINTPATLDFNSPGAQGFGVKRAGLAVPGSVMLLVAPRCCGRNTSALAGDEDLKNRFAYLLLDDKDIITGRHLPHIADAAEAFARSRPQPPTAMMICITCVDALLGTDMERVCRQVEERLGIPSEPCYMYALTRESIRPPMVAVRETVYSLLKPVPRQRDAVNLLGYFAPLDDDTELYDLLRQAGVKHIRELARAKNYAEYLELGKANFNLVLNAEARGAANWFRRELNIPAAEITRLYDTNMIARQYEILAATLHINWNFGSHRARAEAAIKSFVSAHGGVNISVGSRLNANPFELALALAHCGLNVKEILCAPAPQDMAYIKKLGEVSPNTKIYNHLAPIMLNFRVTEPIDLALGKDAHYYHPEAKAVYWHSEVQPYGFSAVRQLFTAMEKALA